MLRGPSTLAYGGTAIGGVVNVIDDRIASEAPINGLEGRVGVQSTSVDSGWAASAVMLLKKTVMKAANNKAVRHFHERLLL